MSGTRTLNLAANADERAADREMMRELLAELRATSAHSTEVLHLFMTQNRNGVLETGVGVIGSDGWFYRDFRAPYAAVAIANTSAASIVVSAGPPQANAPGTGPGAALITGGSFQVVNVTGSDGAVTFYGTAGSRFNYTVYIGPQAPAAGALALVNATGQIPVAGASADNVDGVVPVATGVLRVAAEGYVFTGTGYDRVRAQPATATRPTALLVSGGIASINSLTAVTVTGAGLSVDMGVGISNVSMAVSITGGPATVTVVLEGSLDNVAWFPLATSTNVAGELIASTGKPVSRVRANLTALTGGAAPTVTARLCAAG